MGPSCRLNHDITLADEAATQRLAADVARLARAGDMIALWGDLGSGKTVFARGFITALVGETEVPSPTFSLAQSYDGPDFTIWHFDFYRLDDPWEVLELGFNDALVDGVALVEWPDRLGDLLPADRLDIRMTLTKDGRHTARLEPHGDWAARFDGDVP